MWVKLASGWTTEVERGPDWLFVRLHPPEDGDEDPTGLAERIWQLLEREFARRVVVELDAVPVLRSRLLGELVRLQKRIAIAGGLMRVCGLSDPCREVLRVSRLDRCFPQYRTREDAVMGRLVRRPR